MSVRERNSVVRAHGRAARVLAFALCAFTVFFVVVSTSHNHSEIKGDAACRICQIAHISVPAALLAGGLPAPLIQWSAVPGDIRYLHSALFFSSASSRAPPAA